MRLLHVLAPLLAALGCSTEPPGSERRIQTEAGQAVRVAVTALDDSSVRWATRSVGVSSRRGHVLTLAVDDRPVVVLEEVDTASAAPTAAEIAALVAAVEVQASPDGQHLLVRWPPATSALFHLLPEGPPFRLDLPDAGSPPDWTGVPPTMDLLVAAISGAPEGGCGVGEPMAWQAIAASAGGNALDDAALAVWPGCVFAQDTVKALARPDSAASPEWRRRLAETLDAHVSTATVEDTRRSLLLCLAVGDQARVDPLARSLAEAWPADAQVHDLLLARLDELPADLGLELLARAEADYRSMSFAEQDRAARLLSRWAACDRWRAFAATTGTAVAAREECAG